MIFISCCRFTFSFIFFFADSSPFLVSIVNEIVRALILPCITLSLFVSQISTCIIMRRIVYSLMNNDSLFAQIYCTTKMSFVPWVFFLNYSPDSQWCNAIAISVCWHIEKQSVTMIVSKLKWIIFENPICHGIPHRRWIEIRGRGEGWGEMWHSTTYKIQRNH